MSVKIPQILSGALGAAVYTCLAQRSGSGLLESGGQAPTLAGVVGWPPDWFDVATVLLVLAWTTKNLVDDFKAFETRADPAFNLLLTVFFSAIAYTLLALAASTLFRGTVATEFLSIYFATLALWSFCSWFRRRCRTERDTVALEKLGRRRRWAVMYSICAGSVALALAVGAPLLLIFVVGSVYIVDCQDCGTFSMAEKAI